MKSPKETRSEPPSTMPAERSDGEQPSTAPTLPGPGSAPRECGRDPLATQFEEWSKQEQAPPTVDGEPEKGEEVRRRRDGKLARQGDLIGDYRVYDLIGEGAMGEVWEARNVKDDLRLPVALKLVKMGMVVSEEAIRRFMSEARAVASLHSHPNIVKVYGTGTHGDQLYFAMQLVEGGTLKQHIPRLRGDHQGAVRLMEKVAEAVEYAHSRGLIHRDLKPENILVDKQGSPLVSDFGLARRIDPADSGRSTIAVLSPDPIHEDSHGELALSFPSRTREDHDGVIVGTPAYMPPEQAEGKVRQTTTVSDVYGLGAILYEILTGRPPFIGSNLGDILQKVINEPVQAPRQIDPTVDRDLEAICLKCLRKKPEERYDGAGALVRDLKRWLAHRPVSARPLSSFGRIVHFARHEPAKAGLVLASLLVGALAVWGVIATVRETRERRENLATQSRFLEMTDAIDKIVEIIESGIDTDDAGQRRVREDLLKQTIDLYDRVVEQWKKEPGRSGALAEAYLKRGDCFQYLGSTFYGRARRDYESAVELLAASDQARGEIELRESLAKNHHALGMLNQLENKLAEAKEEFETGRRIREDLCKCELHSKVICEDCDRLLSPERLAWLLSARSGLARSHGYLGDVYLVQGDVEGAKRAYARSHELRQSIVDTTRDSENAESQLFRFELSRSHGNLAAIARFEGDFQLAFDHLDEGAKLRQELRGSMPLGKDLGTHFPTSYDLWDDDAYNLRTYGEYLMEAGRAKGDPMVPEKELTRAAELYGQLIEVKPGRPKYAVGRAWSYLDLADGLFLEGATLGEVGGSKLQQAREYVEKAKKDLEQVREYMEEDRNFQRVASRALSLSGKLLLSENKPAEASKLFDQAYESLQRLIVSGSKDFDTMYAMGDAAFGAEQCHRRSGGVSKAVELWHRRSIECLEKASRYAPGIQAFRVRLQEAIKEGGIDG